MKILYFKPSPAEQSIVNDLNAKRCNSIEELIKEADYVSLHCPGGVSTHHLINQQRLDLMKPSAHLINTARGDVIDTQALINTLNTKKIAGAGLDVYENEPDIDNRLLILENVSLLPHLGSATIATRTAMGEKVLKNLDAFFTDNPLPDQIM